MREAAPAKYPHCWGYSAGKMDSCDGCRFTKSCTSATRSVEGRKTLYQWSELASGESAQESVDPEVLALHAFRFAVSLGMRPYPRWSANQKYADAMERVINSCRQSGVDPLQYVRAQLEALTSFIKIGRTVHPGAFFGKNADARFSRWVTRSGRKYGDVRSNQQNRDKLRRLQSATIEYMEARVSAGLPHSESEARARAYLPDWSLRDVPDHVKTKAIAAAVSSVNPALPHMILSMSPPTRVKEILPIIRRLCPELDEPLHPVKCATQATTDTGTFV